MSPRVHPGSGDGGLERFWGTQARVGYPGSVTRAMGMAATRDLEETGVPVAQSALIFCSGGTGRNFALRQVLGGRKKTGPRTEYAHLISLRLLNLFKS